MNRRELGKRVFGFLGLGSLLGARKPKEPWVAPTTDDWDAPWKYTEFEAWRPLTREMSWTDREILEAQPNGDVYPSGPYDDLGPIGRPFHDL